MATFLIGLVILICGGALYGKFCENIFGPDDRETPAYSRQDGVDYVPMKTWRNSLINLLNIAGTGPIMGPIQGILFGPAAFLAIPIGNVIGGSMHDYFSGMICTRDGGTQMPDFVKDYTNRTVYVLYDVFICLLLLLVGAVFIYTPGDIATTQIFKWSGAATDPTTWIVYVIIFAYYFLATCLPIDKLIGRVYPIFGIILVFSALGIFVAIFAHQYPLTNIWDNWNTVSSTIQGVDATGAAVTINASGFDYGTYFNASHFIPVFFLTVACGILSGFHSTQTALVSRTIESEKNGRMCFYNMMIVEGFIAMCWAAGTMAMINLGAANGGLSMMGNSYLQLTTAEKALTNGALNASYIQAGDQFFHQIGAAAVTGVVCRDALGSIGGTIALIGVVVLPITSGDTALRALRLTLADSLHIRQENNKQRIALAAPVFALVFVILLWAKRDAEGFSRLWRYFAWSNQMISLFALACIAAWMFKSGKSKFVWVPLIPAAFYAFATCSFIVHNPKQLPGASVMSWTAAYIIAAVFTICYLALCVVNGRKKAAQAKA